MFGTEYKSSTGVNMMLALVENRKRPQLYIQDKKEIWVRVAQFDNAKAIEMFLEMFGMSRPEWLGKTYDQLIQERFPFLAKKGNKND
jgi:hypothetical protein